MYVLWIFEHGLFSKMIQDQIHQDIARSTTRFQIYLHLLLLVDIAPETNLLIFKDMRGPLLQRIKISSRKHLL